jgi:predicted ATPase/class 3 adenylate cyclase
MSTVTDAGPASLYVPRILQQHLADAPGERAWQAEGTAAFCDVSGFTKLSERLARKGREGAEQIADAIGHVFEALLEVAYQQGGSLLKFGGDALLLWFEGPMHAPRAARATVLMRRVLRNVGRIDLPGARVTLKMSQAVHTGSFHFFAVGVTHHELLPAGPAWSRLVAMEHVASGGEIVISPETARLLPAGCVGATKGDGRMLRREPPGKTTLPLVARPAMAAEAIAHCLAPAVRAHVLAGGGNAELRPVSIAFLRFDGIDALIAEQGPARAADALHELVRTVEAATEAQDITFLASDVDMDGGKIILTAGAPKVTGDDEERMLLALRAIVSTRLAIPIRVGVHRGSVFAGDIGPFYRRTYTVMGDAVNLAARVMSKASPGHVYATADVLDRSNTLFATTALEPFMVKGKAKPVQAWDVGAATGSRARQVALEQLPLIGRDAEVQVLRGAVAAARAGKGCLIEIVGEPGIGKTRLLEALRAEANDLIHVDATCEAYTSSTPYVAWREVLRERLGIGRDDAEAAVVARLREIVDRRIPGLAPWFPLLAAVFEIEVPTTAEVEMLAEKNRRVKLHEVTGRFLAQVVPGPALVMFENAHHMDEASAALLTYLTGEIASRPWVVAVARRPAASGFSAPDGPSVARIALEPLAQGDALAIARVVAEQHPLPIHVLEVVARRSGGNPQFLRDLLRTAIATGGVSGLPDSAEAAAMARIDALAPDDRALIRRAAVFGLTFHPRMLGWFADEMGEAPPGHATWERLSEFFEAEHEGYLRFRRSLLRDTAYEGLPYKTRRRLHGVVAARLERESSDPEDLAAILSLHFLVAGEHGQAWRLANVAAKRALAVYAYVEAAELLTRALEAARRLDDMDPKELAIAQETLGDSWNRAGEFEKAVDAFNIALRMRAVAPVEESGLLLKRSRIEEKLGRYPQALRWAARARKALDGQSGPTAMRRAAQCSAWYATVLQAEGRSADAVRWAERAMREAEAADEPDALGAACFVIGWAYATQGNSGWEPLIQRSLAAYQRSGDRVKQAVILSNVGVVCQGEGRWDEAMGYYERSRVECLKIGDAVNAALARINIAEILIDRGQIDEAEAILRDVLPLWRASRYRYFLGACHLLLGRAALRAGRLDEAAQRLEEARTHFAHVGAEQEVLAVDARLAECRAFAVDPDGALQLASATLDRAGSASGVAPLLDRVRGYALLQKGDRTGAHRAFAAGLASARARNDRFEIMLILTALIALEHAEGAPIPPAMDRERDSLRENLKIRSIPAPPLAIR